MSKPMEPKVLASDSGARKSGFPAYGGPQKLSSRFPTVRSADTVLPETAAKLEVKSYVPSLCSAASSCSSYIMISPTAAIVTVVSGSVGTAACDTSVCAVSCAVCCVCSVFLRALQPRTIRTSDKIRITSKSPSTMRCCILRRRRSSSRLSRRASNNCSSRSNSCSSIKLLSRQTASKSPVFAMRSDYKTMKLFS